MSYFIGTVIFIFPFKMHPISKYIWCFALFCGCACLNVVSYTSEHLDKESSDQEDIGASALLMPVPVDDTRKFLNLSQIIDITKFTKKPKTTTTTTMKPNTTTLPTVSPACTCGTGGKPSVLNVTTKRFNNEEIFSDDTFGSDEEIEDGDEDHGRSTGKSNDFRIVHGSASKPNAWPWMVALIRGYSTNRTSILNQFCGGSLINAQTVITVAHCFNNLTTAQILSDVRVLLGTNSLLSNVTDRTVVTISGVTIHPKFNSTTFDNDIAILNLARPVPISNTIRPICLSQTGTPFNKRNAVVAGWGTAQTIEASNFKGQKWLREAGMQTMPNTRCTKLGEVVTPRMICALGWAPVVNSSSTCFGDSGGPLMIYRPKSKTFSLIGLVSHGMTPCGVKAPPVFTRVGSFLPFIRSSANGTQFCSNSFT